VDGIKKEDSLQPLKVNLQAITDERGAEYGDFTHQGIIAQDLKEYMREQDGWKRLKSHQKESLDMIMHKVSRILNGNPENRDSWVDIAGYAQISAERIIDR
jgi:hypothetical protein